jgi:pimeloyl-ACP methyl ester carboxylesterase
MRKKFVKGLFITSSIIAAMELINRSISKNTEPLSNVLEGESSYFKSSLGKIFYVKKGAGEPILFLHGIASGTSSFMWRKNFDELSKNFTVYAFDFPGFGKSEKLPVVYKSKNYIMVIKEFINEIIGTAPYIIASNLSAAYTVQLEYLFPGTVKKIAAICPTGVYELSTPPSPGQKAVSLSFRLPVVGTFMYNILVSKPGVSYFIKRKTYYNKNLASKYVINHYRKSSRQDGKLSKYGPLSFLSGNLNQNIINTLTLLDIPMYIIWGENATMNKIDNLLSFITLNSKIKYHIFQNCGYLPQEEYPLEFNELCKNFFLESNNVLAE